MKADQIKRLEDLETTSSDWVSRLDCVDYVGLCDYEDGSWKEIFFDQTITVLENLITGEIRGVYNDRRTKAEMLEQGVNLAYL